MSYSFSRSGRLFVKKQTVIGTAISLAGANCCRHTSVSIKPNNPRSMRNDKTGTLSRSPGIGGQRSADVSVTMDLAGSGTAGTAPDCAPFLESWFGQGGNASAGVSVTYSLADATIPLTLAHYRLPSTVNQQLAWGLNIESLNFGFNDGTIAKMSASGKAVYACGSLSFSALDTGGKGGLVSFPAEPSSPVTNGNVVSAFQGSLTLNSNAIATVKSGSLKLSRPIELENQFGSYYAASASPTSRDVSLSFELWDDDSTAMTDLLQHGQNDTTFGATLVLGNVAGNIWTFTLNGFQISPPSLEDGQNRWSANFGSISATSTVPANTDEVSLVIT